MLWRKKFPLCCDYASVSAASFFFFRSDSILRQCLSVFPHFFPPSFTPAPSLHHRAVIVYNTPSYDKAIPYSPVWQRVRALQNEAKKRQCGDRVHRRGRTCSWCCCLLHMKTAWLDLCVSKNSITVCWRRQSLYCHTQQTGADRDRWQREEWCHITDEDKAAT